MSFVVYADADEVNTNMTHYSRMYAFESLDTSLYDSTFGFTLFINKT